jgi:predicted DNA-binding transcriptional regulator YafY
MLENSAVGGCRVKTGADLPKLLLDDDEAVAVAIGLCTAASGSISGIGESSLRASAKLEQVLPRQLRPPLESRRLRSRPQRLALFPCRPPHARDSNRSSLHPARATR